MSKLKPKYITVPVNLLKNIHTDQEKAIRQMLDFGIYDRMRKNYPNLEHEDFEEDAIEESRAYFNLSKIDDAECVERLELGKELYDTFNGTPNASINLTILSNFNQEKTEFELMVFSHYVAIRSIMGEEAYYHSKTKKGEPDFWIVRAFGYSSKEDFKQSNPTQGEKDLRAKYFKRYWFGLVKEELINNWSLIFRHWIYNL